MPLVPVPLVLVLLGVAGDPGGESSACALMRCCCLRLLVVIFVVAVVVVVNSTGNCRIGEKSGE